MTCHFSYYGSVDVVTPYGYLWCICSGWWVYLFGRHDTVASRNTINNLITAGSEVKKTLPGLWRWKWCRVNVERYVHMFLRPELRRRRMNMPYVYFQEHVPGWVISRFGDVPWPPRSPDLTACDFFLWAYLKSRVYTNNAHTLVKLKEAIREKVATIHREMLNFS